MARSSIQQRQDAERRRVAKYEASLRKPRPVPERDAAALVRLILAGFEHRALRDPAAWPGRIRSRDPGRIALALARHLFARYPVAPHLERIWIADERLPAAEIHRRKRWYIEAAQGGSLYKSCTRDLLTKRETHAFLNPPVRLGFEEALWHAVAAPSAPDLGTALRVARSKVARHPVTPFWREAARFFATHRTPLNEIDDLCDYFEARLQADAGYSLKGRTPASLGAQMAEWHRDLARARRIGGGQWPGEALPDWSLREENGQPPHLAVTWKVVQIKTGDALAAEGRAMHHCVYTYKARCMSGASSIWSLRKAQWAGEQRLLTLEMNARRELVQIRGPANRLAKPEELRILRRWAAASGVRGA